MGRATARAPLEIPNALNAPLFRQLLDKLDPQRRICILDLGAASTEMLALLSEYRCRVEIAHLVSDEGIERLHAAESQDQRIATATSLLPAHSENDPLDLIFCWDLPNYIRPEAMSAIMSVIATRSSLDARAHALIVYSERTMPVVPGRFVPQVDSKLVNRNAVAAAMDAPRYSPEALGKIMSPFGNDAARLLANGMQEFVFKLSS